MQEPSQTERETDELAERFFSQPPPAWEVEHDEWHPAPLSSSERLAILATVAPVAIGITVAVGLLLLSLPMFAEAAPEDGARAQASGAPARPAPDPTHHGLTALAKATPLVTTATATAPAMPTIVPATPTATRAPAARSPLALARRALDAGKPQQARELATQAIGRNPTSAAAYIVLAGALDALGDRAGMKATFHACAERATDSLASACKSLAR